MKRSFLVLAMFLAAAGCFRRSEPVGGDVLSDQKSTTTVYATTECTAKNPQGTEGVDYCNQKTCKKDAESNCQQFAASCLDSGHHYAGTADAGTCSRIL
jgi:hypothetical protein